MLAELPFLGRKINLISKCDIRYEGVLYSIDPKESTIALSKVRSFGTEDRVSGRGFIPSKEEVYEYIIFRASDVKDLKLGDSDHLTGLSDPAIIQAVGPKTMNSNNMNVNGRHSSVGHSRSRRARYGSRSRGHNNVSAGGGRNDAGNQGHNQGRRSSRGPRSNGRSSNMIMNGQNYGQNMGNNQRDAHDRRPRMDNGQRGGRGPPSHMRGQRPFGGPRRQLSQRRDSRREPLKFEGDFDFQKANEEFAELDQKFAEKLTISGSPAEPDTAANNCDGQTPTVTVKKEENGTGADSATNEATDKASTPAVVAYDKERSFFDSLTCRQNSKPDWRKERRINAETFGVAY